MSSQQTLGFAGAGLLAIGVFLPLVSMPFVGSITYINNGQGDGMIVLGLAAISLLIVLAKRYRALWITGLASLALIGYTFVSIRAAMATVQRQLADNPFRGLANIQLQWGWAVLVLGAVLLLAAAARRKVAVAEPAPM